MTPCAVCGGPVDPDVIHVAHDPVSCIPRDCGDGWDCDCPEVCASCCTDPGCPTRRPGRVTPTSPHRSTTTTMNSDDKRLYGIPGAEDMHLDLASAYESQIDPYHDEHSSRPAQIEEWSSVPLGNSLPSAYHVIEWAAEMACEDVTEAAWEVIENASNDHEIQTAFVDAFNLWASKITYRMADKLIHTWQITWDDQGEPLADGEPIYRKVTSDG